MSHPYQSPQARINHKIRAREVRVISSTGEQLGVMPISQALAKATESNLDLIEIAPNAEPPVCKIVEYGKYKYEQAKKEKEIRKNQQGIKTKEVQFHPAIDEHDYQTKVRHIREFLEDKMKVRVLMCYRGREMAHQEFGREIITRVIQDIQDVGVVDSPPRLNGKTLGVLLRSA